MRLTAKENLKWKVPVTVLTSDRYEAIIDLPTGKALVVLIRKEKPCVVDIQGPGEIRVRCAAMCKPPTSWPVVVVTVRSEDLQDWLNLKAPQVNRVIDRATRAALHYSTTAGNA